MKSHIIPKNPSFNDIEVAIGDLYGNNDIALRLPNSLKYKGNMGVEGLVCQVLATWIRISKKTIFHSYSSPRDVECFKDLSLTLYGVIGVRLFDEVHFNDHSLVKPNDVLKYAFDAVRKVNSRQYNKAYKGSYLPVFSIKTPTVDKEFNNIFYLGRSEIDRQYVNSLVEQILGTMIKSHSKRDFLADFIESVAGIVAELFENTHNHARTDYKGDVLQKNFRAVIFSISDVDEYRMEHLIKNRGAQGFLSTYTQWSGWKKKHESKKLSILEITVVDSGPGFARRWTGKDSSELNYSEEVESVLKCFEKGKTTSTNFASGSGLTFVLNDLKKLNGWFRLRTGRVAASKSFFDSMGNNYLEEKDIEKKVSFIEGCSFNIVVPMVDVSDRG